MKNYLKELMNEQKLCCVYLDDRDLNKFAVGYVIGVDDEFFLVEAIDPSGNGDGVFAAVIEHIVKLEVEDSYVKRIKKLFYHKKQSRYETLSFGGEILEGMIKHALKYKKICSFELCDSGRLDIVGYVSEFDEEAEIVKVQALDRDGQDDGVTATEIRNITEMQFDSSDELRLEILKL
ncbi:hypothetical protein FACS1894211_02810 [Clostridia bacterium]|nr:hypothetical protein FACS1894211_02810 [Clostridia bacterium]